MTNVFEMSRKELLLGLKLREVPPPGDGVEIEEDEEVRDVKEGKRIARNLGDMKKEP